VEHIANALRNSHPDTRVGIFTSPHLHTARERIKINNELISKPDLVRLGRAALANAEEWSVFFDHFLSVAIQYFGFRKCDYVVLETGIGGRYDSTNFVENPAVGVITSISYDHQAILGDTLTLIAQQKAGIIKPGMHIFTPGTQEPEVLVVIADQCKEVNAVLHVVHTDDYFPFSTANVNAYHTKIAGGTLTGTPTSTSTSTGTSDSPQPASPRGRGGSDAVRSRGGSDATRSRGGSDATRARGLSYAERCREFAYSVQCQNASLALAVVKHLGLSTDTMQDGFFWPCRMETFQVQRSHAWTRAAAGLPYDLDANNSNSGSSTSTATVVLDGAHNGDSVKQFLLGLRKIYPKRQIHVLFGAGLEKNLDDMLAILANKEQCDSVQFVQSKHFRAASETDLADLSKRAGYKVPIWTYGSPALKVGGGVGGDYRMAAPSVDGAAQTSGKPSSSASSTSTSNSTVILRLAEAILHRHTDLPKATQGGAGSGAVVAGASKFDEGPVIAVCGSLFTAAEAREALYSLEPGLFQENDWVTMQDPF
jgi:folylpolyglutamate synthase/dihydropteroate synthase